MATFEKVSYTKTFEVKLLATAFWEKIGVEVTLQPGDDAKQAIEEASKLVHEYHNEANKDLFRSAQLPVVDINNDIEVDAEFNKIKEALNTLSNREDAALYLQTTDFKHSLEAKGIVNSKPSKK
jgi:hypothetical protein